MPWPESNAHPNRLVTHTSIINLTLMSDTTTDTLFNRIGGMPAVEAAVEIFYGKVIRDERISHFFAHIDMERQAGKLRGFLAYALGAPISYTGKSMRDAHHHMRLTDAHFEAVAEQLVNTLQDLQVPESLIAEVVALVAGTRNDIVTVS